MTPIDWTAADTIALATDTPQAADWNRLNAARGDLPFLSAAAIAAALATFGSGAERLFVGRQSGRVVAMFVLVPQGRWRWATFQPSQLPLGAWVAEAGLGTVLLATSLMQRGLGACLLLSLTQVDPAFAPRDADEANTHHADYIETGWLDVDGSYADYWAARGKNLRQNLRKQRNKLAAEGVAASLHVWTAAADMAPALARYGALESAGWKAGGGTAIHADNAQGRFYSRLFEDAAARGEALVCEYRFDDRCVAMNLGLLRGGVLVVLKTAYDESIKLYSPASLLREEELQRFFGTGSGVRRIEYYGRLMDWHTRLTDRKRTLHHLTVYRWPLLKRLAEIRRASAAARTAAITANAPISPATEAAAATASSHG
jgi:CelD/BcsL family acetyltransferase involved in cellulose biosynthesis